MSIEKEKEMFEAWYEKHHNGRQISCDYVSEESSYSIGYANAMWISWLASTNREGYKLVPVEPTLKMLEDAAYEHVLHGASYSGIYKAMIGED